MHTKTINCDGYLGVPLPDRRPMVGPTAFFTGAASGIATVGAVLALHLWSVRGGVITVAALSSAVLLLTAARRRRGADQAATKRAG